VLAWILDRCSGRVGATETPIGYMPNAGDLNTTGLNVSAEAMQELTAVPTDAWRKEMDEFRAYLQEYGARTPAAMLEEVDEVSRRLDSAR